MTLDVIHADWSAPEFVRALTTTRIGGVSQAPFDALNLGLHVGDDAVHVQENRRRVADMLSLPSEPVWLKQTHGIVVANLDEMNDFSGACTNRLIEADGAWTSTPGCVLAVLTADCLPVVLCSQDGTRIAAVHAGWRGLAAGVLESAIELFDANDALFAWLGPAIGPRAFEVGEEVRQVFLSKDSGNRMAFAKHNEPNKWLADLYQLARRQLQALGNIEVSGGGHCTVTDAHRFHSHRRDGLRSGRMATLVWMNPW